MDLVVDLLLLVLILVRVNMKKGGDILVLMDLEDRLEQLVQEEVEELEEPPDMMLTTFPTEFRVPIVIHQSMQITI